MPTIQEILQTLSTGLVPGASSAAGALNQTGAQMPDIGMPGITVRGPSQAQAAPQLPPQTSGMTQSPNPGMASPLPFPPPQEETQGGSNPIFDILKALAIPLATTGVGLGIPGALPGAAGFQTGFAEQQATQRERQSKEKLAGAKTEEKEQDFKEKRMKRAENMALSIAEQNAGEYGDITAKDLKQTFNDVYELFFPEETKTSTDIGKDVIAREKAKQILLSAGKDASDKSVDEFIKLNKDF